MDKESPILTKDIEPDRLEFEYLDPKAVHLSRGPSGAARLMIDGHDKCYLKFMVVCAFPLSSPDTAIGFLDGHWNDVGTIRGTRGLDAESRTIVQEELQRRYFRPRISKVIRFSHEFELSYVEVETDRGKRDFTLRGHRENIQEIEPGRYLIEDVDGNRFEIENFRKLDPKSQEYLSQVL
jgi:hypothetical protein